MKRLAFYILILTLGSGSSLSAQNLCDRFPDLMKRLALKDIELIAGMEYVDIFTNTTEYRPAVTFPQMIDDRVSSSLRVFPPSQAKAPVLQYSFQMNEKNLDEKQKLESIKEELQSCGLKGWKAETVVDESFGNTFIVISSDKSDEKITLSTASAFLDGFSRITVLVLQIELVGWN